MTDLSTSRFPAASLALAMVISGTVGAFVTEARLDPVTVVFWRCAFGSLFLAAWCLIRGILPDRSLSAARLLRAALCGVCMALCWAAFFAGFGLTSIATATILIHTQPFFIVLIGAVLLKERITADQIAWMAAAFGGVVLASGLVVSSTRLDAAWTLGMALSLGAALLYAASTMLAKGLGEQRPEVTALCQTVVGMALLAPFTHGAGAIPAASWGWLAGIGMLHTGIAYILMYAAYPRLTTPVIGVLTFIYPVVAILIDWLVYGHPLGWGQAAGMALIALGTLGVRLGWRLPTRRISAA